MPRKPVQQKENVTYHVWTRCIEWKPKMKKETFKELLLEVIAKTQEKYNFELNQYVILDNHIHLIIYTLPGEASISRIMQYLKSRFAEKYNKKTKRIGPFWNERYRYKIVEDSDDPIPYLLHLLWYLAYNSVRKNMVTDPRKYKYSGIHSYLKENYTSKATVTLHKFFYDLGKSFTERAGKLLELESYFISSKGYPPENVMV